MFPEKTMAWGKARSCIRELAEYGWKRKAEIGAENVYDFSLGNPSIPAPDCVNEAIADLIRGDSVALHGYTTAAGLPSLRQRIAADYKERFGVELDPDRMYVTCGAAAGLAISLRALLMPGEEVVALAPFFPEYRVFVEAAGGVLVTAPPAMPDFQPDFAALAACLTEKTKAIVVNSPNNPSGVVLTEESLRKLADTLRSHEKKTGNAVYLICDEPYRELVYDGVEVPSVFRYYDDTILCYSFSKSLSIPGERIGYVAVGPKAKDGAEIYAGILGAGRALGYVNPPSLFQRVIERCLGATADVSKYRENRDLLLGALREMGYECVEPQGAFYLFVKAPEADAKAFSERAKRHELLLVPSDDFGVKGYVRIAYCVSKDMISRSLPAFRALMAEYRI
ncbi:MAG: pyridoxal phosphate-dependent aminotransferase [Oscillospiraceae bacterium]|nr:pyridoxal phosphate-dependent aminotransferase [Oscillospiraceae bacterium]